MFECTHICKFLVHLAYVIRQETVPLEKDEKAEVPGITNANNLSPTGENKECVVIRKK